MVPVCKFAFPSVNTPEFKVTPPGPDITPEKVSLFPSAIVNEPDPRVTRLFIGPVIFPIVVLNPYKSRVDKGSRVTVELNPRALLFPEVAIPALKVEPFAIVVGPL